LNHKKRSNERNFGAEKVCQTSILKLPKEGKHSSYSSFVRKRRTPSPQEEMNKTMMSQGNDGLLSRKHVSQPKVRVKVNFPLSLFLSLIPSFPFSLSYLHKCSCDTT
jgi:hypothetical protein